MRTLLFGLLALATAAHAVPDEIKDYVPPLPWPYSFVVTNESTTVCGNDDVPLRATDGTYTCGPAVPVDVEDVVSIQASQVPVTADVVAGFIDTTGQLLGYFPFRERCMGTGDPDPCCTAFKTGDCFMIQSLSGVTIPGSVAVPPDKTHGGCLVLSEPGDVGANTWSWCVSDAGLAGDVVQTLSGDVSCIDIPGMRIRCAASGSCTSDLGVEGTGMVTTVASFPEGSDTVGYATFGVPENMDTAQAATVQIRWGSSHGDCNNNAADDVCFTVDAGSVANETAFFSSPTLGGTAIGITDRCHLTNEVQLSTATAFTHGLTAGQEGILAIGRDDDGSVCGANSDDYTQAALIENVRFCYHVASPFSGVLNVTTSTVVVTTSTSTSSSSTTSTSVAVAGDPAENWVTSTKLWSWHNMEQDTGNPRVNNPATVCGSACNLAEAGTTAGVARNGSFKSEADFSAEFSNADGDRLTCDHLTCDGVLGYDAPTFTAIAWARDSTSGASRRILDKLQGNAGFSMDRNFNQAAVNCKVGDGTNQLQSRTVNNTSNTGTGQYFACAYNSGGTLISYAGGAQSIGFTTGTATTNASGSGKFGIGGLGSTWNGEIDDVSFWTAKLTDAQICYISSCGVDGRRCTCEHLATTYKTCGNDDDCRNCASCSDRAECDLTSGTCRGTEGLTCTLPICGATEP